VVLHNDQNPYTVGLIFPNHVALERALKEKDTDFSEQAGQKEALKLIQSEINEFKKGGHYEGEFPERWLPSAIAVLDEGFN
jgi:long-chain acyl-CoA synthetase